MALTEVACAHCGKIAALQSGHVNRARSRGLKLYCGRVCSGLGRRGAPKTDAEKKAAKSAYDAEYRVKNIEIIKSKKKTYYAENFDRDKEREYRSRTMSRHVEYCRSTEYRAYKREYDREHRAKAEYGEYWECFLLTQQIHDAAVEKAGGWYELALLKGTLNKAKQRRMDYDRLDGEEPETGPLGHLERGERR